MILHLLVAAVELESQDGKHKYLLDSPGSSSLLTISSITFIHSSQSPPTNKQSFKMRVQQVIGTAAVLFACGALGAPTGALSMFFGS